MIQGLCALGNNVFLERRRDDKWGKGIQRNILTSFAHGFARARAHTWVHRLASAPAHAPVSAAMGSAF